MSSVRVPNRSRLCGSPIRPALHAAAKSAPRRKSRFPCMTCREGPAREHSASAALSGLDLLDFVDNVPAFDDLAEHAVAPTLGVRGRVVEEAVVLDVDEELARSRMRFGGPRHGDRIALVLEAVAGLVFDGSSG